MSYRILLNVAALIRDGKIEHHPINTTKRLVFQHYAADMDGEMLYLDGRNALIGMELPEHLREYVMGYTIHHVISDKQVGERAPGKYVHKKATACVNRTGPSTQGWDTSPRSEINISCSDIRDAVELLERILAGTITPTVAFGGKQIHPMTPRGLYHTLRDAISGWWKHRQYIRQLEAMP